MSHSPPVDRFPKMLPGAMLRIALAAACLSFTAAPSFARSQDVPAAKMVTKIKPLFPTARGKVRQSGSAYVCIPSGFGQKGRCVLRARMLRERAGT
ncbi:hypothetical protein [Ciceribacter azotifigens]|uniref:hypothetical protein n=1 Tax=Ciceribacter azotifigens TaxID=2069303 RepID=UPI003A89B6BD